MSVHGADGLKVGATRVGIPVFVLTDAGLVAEQAAVAQVEDFVPAPMVGVDVHPVVAEAAVARKEIDVVRDVILAVVVETVFVIATVNWRPG